ncbi:MAG: hypothetical protein LIP04_00335 [Tannerellaceae bacterium]|nr:hypothetical protein [Tannerellaceae bacterium]
MKLKSLLCGLLVIGTMVGIESCEKEDEEVGAISRSSLHIEEAEYEEEISYVLKRLTCAPTPVAGAKDHITGKWQVVWGWYSPELPVEKLDRSCDKIFYEFLPDNRLVVTGDPTHPLAGENRYSYAVYQGMDHVSFATSGANLYINDLLFLAIPYTKHIDLIETLGYSLSEKLIRVE